MNIPEASAQSSDKDPRLKVFAHAIAFGMPLRAAMIHSGYGTEHVSLAMQLLGDPSVQAIIDEDREWQKSKMAASREMLASQLDHDRGFAYQELNPAAAIAATLGKAKLYGFMDVNSSNKVPSKITIEWSSDSTETIYPIEEIVLLDEVQDD